MKLLVLLASVVALSAMNVIPYIPGDNRHYIEGESRYIWMPDGDGKPVLVDLHEPVDENYLNSRTIASNQYWLFTRRNPNDRQIIYHGNASSIWNSYYHRDRPLKVIVHGWFNSGITKMNPLITSAFLHVQDCNVIVVDWSDLASYIYNTASKGVPNVGQHLANFLVWLFNTAGGNWSNVHLVGFSLGAHIVGIAGRLVGGLPARVTGLDPAGLGWSNDRNALNRCDGHYVEVIHTDGGFLGTMDPIGDADFYPNGGINPQPGCWISICSHGRASEFFAATVRYNHLVGRRCANLSEVELMTCNGSPFHMGNTAICKRGAGIFGLKTGAKWPY